MIVNQQRNVRFARKPLETFLRRVKKELGVQGFAVTVCFVSDVEIAGMNERFRKKTGPTDVLSFPAGKRRRVLAGGRRRINAEETPKGRGEAESRTAERYLGDIAIAPETARLYAKTNGRSLSNELRVLILHGVLHLMGYDHETDRGEMNRIEQKMRRRFRLS
jgi:probable rRNA maturation factor